jgi:hypothetical protein
VRHVCLLSVLVVVLVVWGGVASSATLSVRGGNVVLSIVSATAGQEPDPLVNQVANALKYRKERGAPPQKITVETDVGSPLFTLKVEAVGVRNGVSVGELTLSTTAQDLIVDISRNGSKSCDIRYTLEARVADGTGTDAHTVTYTIMAN